MHLWQTLPTLPQTAWEQAVFVTLFVFFCLSLIAGLLNWFSRQQKQWQEFIDQQNEAWQGFMARSEERTAAALLSLNRSLEKVAERMDAHDQRVEDRINAAVERRTQPRKPLTPPT